MASTSENQQPSRMSKIFKKRPKNIWCSLVDHNFRLMGNPFRVSTVDDDDVEVLKNKVKEAKKEILSRNEVDASDLIVWHTWGTKAINRPTRECVELVLASIDVKDRSSIEQLDVEANIGSKDWHLLVQMPAERLTWLLIVDHEFKNRFGTLFSVQTSERDCVNHLKDKVKETNTHARADVSDLTVWRTKGSLSLVAPDRRRLADVLRNIDVRDPTTIEELTDFMAVTSLGLAPGETLLMQLPDPNLNTTQLLGKLVSDVDQKYRISFIKAYTRGTFSLDDLSLNAITSWDTNSSVPNFVEGYEELLWQKRRTAGNVDAAQFIDEAARIEYFGDSTDDGLPIAGRKEAMHIGLISLAKWARMWQTIRDGSRVFKEDHANWMFFYTLAEHFESLSGITVKFGQEPWPFSLVVHVIDRYYTYKPRSDFLVLRCGLPRVAVEVNSNPLGRTPVDYLRLIIQGASIVRFANAFLGAYRSRRNFVYVAIFITGTAVAERYVLYQEGSSDEVFSRTRSFQLSEKIDRANFVRELYNISFGWNAESEDDTQHQVELLTQHVQNFRNVLPAFTGTKRPATDDGGNEPGPSSRQRRNDGGDIDQLESRGYRVVQDIIETDGGDWELISGLKLPPHIRTVYQRNDVSKTELIAKRVREGSNELNIFRTLRTIHPPSPYIISLIEAIPSTTGAWLIQPKLLSVRNRQLLDDGGVCGRIRLSWGLIKGVAYLHDHNIAHLDIKPDNLVCDNDFHLQIIDFDVAIEVQGEDTNICKYFGTEGWTAPELGKQDSPIMYSPIKADRWACGRVVLQHFMVGEDDKRLSKFADQLMANDPQQRPSLREWHEWYASEVTSVRGEDLSSPRKAGGSMKMPDAKRPRLAIEQVFSQTVRMTR